MDKLEKKKEILREKEDLLVLEKERNLSLEESLAKEKDKVEKLATDLSLANDSNVTMSKDHALAKDSLVSLKNAHSELQERHSRLKDINKELEVSYSTFWERIKSSSKANLDSNASTSKGCSKCYNHDINACVTNLSKLEEAIKGKDNQIHKLNLLVGKGNFKPKSDFKSHPAYDTARRFPSIGDGLGLTRGNKVNGTKIVNGQVIPLWNKGANLEDLMTMAHNGKVEATTKVNTNNKKVLSLISRNYTIDHTAMIQNGKMVVKYIGAHTMKLRSVWVPKMAYSNLQGPKQVWVPKTCLVAKSDLGWLWHCRLAHVGMRNLAKLQKNGHILELTNVVFEKDRLCSACQAGK